MKSGGNRTAVQCNDEVLLLQGIAQKAVKAVADTKKGCLNNECENDVNELTREAAIASLAVSAEKKKCVWEELEELEREADIQNKKSNVIINDQKNSKRRHGSTY